VLQNPRFAAIFGPGSRAEASIVGTVRIGATDRAVSGKIDRLVVTPTEVLIVDFKTNRPAPSALAEVPQAYIAQLALYRELLRPIYPDRPVAAALLFTETPLLLEAPAEALEQALARLARA
jgi:ATP-dependent helicase/nuclease subunit A